MSASLLPIDLLELLAKDVTGNRDRSEPRLKVSTDLVGSLRHTQLRLAGAPEKPRALVDDIRMQTGTYWHERMNKAIMRVGWPYMQEVRLTDYLPEGWGGRADGLIFDPEARAWVLGDYKTARSESLNYLGRDGAKEAHVWQGSAYFYALLKMGLDMFDEFFILYWPIQNEGTKAVTEPIIVSCSPLPQEQVQNLMEERWELTKEYLESLAILHYPHEDNNAVWWLSHKLAPEMERELKVSWNKTRDCFDVKLVPNWATAYCPYDDALCACSKQGTTKIGEWRRDTPHAFNITNEAACPLEVPQPTAADWRKHPSSSNGGS